MGLARCTDRLRYYQPPGSTTVRQIQALNPSETARARQRVQRELQTATTIEVTTIKKPRGLFRRNAAEEQVPPLRMRPSTVHLSSVRSEIQIARARQCSESCTDRHLRRSGHHQSRRLFRRKPEACATASSAAVRRSSLRHRTYRERDSSESEIREAARAAPTGTSTDNETITGIHRLMLPRLLNAH